MSEELRRGLFAKGNGPCPRPINASRVSALLHLSLNVLQSDSITSTPTGADPAAKPGQVLARKTEYVDGA